MNKVCGIVGKPLSKQRMMIPFSPLSTFDLELLSDKSWRVGIDQSTSCTGVAAISSDGEYVVLIDIRRDKTLSKEIFYKELHYFLKRFFHNQKIEMLVIEKPVPSKFRSAGGVLTELKGHLEAWFADIPELDNTIYDSLYPQSWKSLVIDSSKGKNRFNDKSAIAEDLSDMYPCLRYYFTTYPYTDYDSFDALGLIVGYLQYAYDKNGVRQICGTKEKTHTSLACYKWVSLEELSNGVPSILKEAYFVFHPKFLSFNNKYDLADNARMASSNNDAIITLLPEYTNYTLQWKYGFDVSESNHVMLMLVIRKGAFSSGEIGALKVLFPWNEEIFDN